MLHVRCDSSATSSCKRSFLPLMVLLPTQNINGADFAVNMPCSTALLSLLASLHEALHQKQHCFRCCWHHACRTT
jgi:hypothetical protein